MQALEIIGRKRDGLEHTPEEIQELLSGYLEGVIPDYQLAAWLMAVCTRGMTRAETLALTQAMVASGESLDLSSIPGVKVDKHSTGGVGDKVTLVSGPLAAACGVPVPKLSGRALAHTGGTLDKLESVPGLSVELEPEQFLAQVRQIGLAVAAQSPQLVPADKALYALRDVTATVPSMPLIASSVMSKKLAAGADAIVLDVKCGRGAFMPDVQSAAALAEEMVWLGEAAGRRVVALVTDMNNPLGRAVGNALEVQEALDALQGEGDEELLQVCVSVAREMCRLAGVEADPAAALRDGSGLERFRRLLAAQGGRLEEGLPVAACTLPLSAPTEGYVAAIDALQIGLGCLQLGAGRQKKTDVIDPGAGILIEAPVGHHVRAGEPLAIVHARSEELIREVAPRLEAAWRIVSQDVVRPRHILARVDREGVATLS
ncbi:MAG: thymidine phosphorylase [Candidatus Dormibacter sp.]|uniref:thymidine phosphorylase n=1 Tax=Candidatus Dormibacter sp. TaxID=2973982 RepID=UPI000DB26B9A|nr:MAG: thymidine phosphorylase [Candidatus Dormibacteraeota bacterium]